jgi:hypothetical protein
MMPGMHGTTYAHFSTSHLRNGGSYYWLSSCNQARLVSTLPQRLINKKYFDTLIPGISGFRNDLPTEFARIRDSRGGLSHDEQISLISELCAKFQMFSHLPLCYDANKNGIGASVEMDPNKPSQVGSGGVLGPVPMHVRTAELGFPMATRSKSVQEAAKARAKKERQAIEADSFEL